MRTIWRAFWSAFVDGFWRGYHRAKGSTTPTTLGAATEMPPPVLIVVPIAPADDALRQVQRCEDTLRFCARHDLIPTRFH